MDTFKDKRGRAWEKLVDEAYFGLVCVRCLDCGKGFNSHMSFHFMTEQKADEFMALLMEAH